METHFHSKAKKLCSIESSKALEIKAGLRWYAMIPKSLQHVAILQKWSKKWIIQGCKLMNGSEWLTPTCAPCWSSCLGGGTWWNSEAGLQQIGSKLWVHARGTQQCAVVFKLLPSATKTQIQISDWLQDFAVALALPLPKNCTYFYVSVCLSVT